MAGTLTISTLSDGTNSTSSTNCIQGSAKAWVNFNGVTTVTIRASFNVSSVTRNGTGDYTVNFTTAFADANYAPNISASPDYAASPTCINLNVQSSGLAEVAPTTSAFRFLNSYPTTATRVDAKYASVSVFR